ncbi:MAG TPA: hypothetical protein VE086_00760 [Chthoniobacterales bacterium]|nr:hypothetical protein [Chthoniobacterales bacterium]
MRKQYYFRPSDRGYKAWDVDRLVALTRNFPRINVALRDLRELDEAFPADEKGIVTWRNVVGHMALIEAADPSYPIILAANGQVMDGRHRVAKALRAGRTTIKAVQFTIDPEPDYGDVYPEELPYEEESLDGTSFRP